ncbi:MAPEG family protein [Ramlibacter sp.]|uniref:MAPEG family protein n=1 Tax=Ramlibacter sp. TaxID=1917967 RepID=UPI003D1408E8
MMKLTVAYWCVLIASLLPFVCAWLAKSKGFGKSRKTGGFDNDDPRAWLAKQTGWQARANAAQANSFEALPFFIGAVVIAHQLAAPQATLDILAVLFVTLRIIYIAMYVAGLSLVRSGIWALALLVNIGIFFLGWR